MVVNGLSQHRRQLDAVATVTLAVGGDAEGLGWELHRQIAAGCGLPEPGPDARFTGRRLVDLDVLLDDVDPAERLDLLARMVDELAARLGSLLAVARGLATGDTLPAMGLRLSTRQDDTGGDAS